MKNNVLLNAVKRKPRVLGNCIDCEVGAAHALPARPPACCLACMPCPPRCPPTLPPRLAAFPTSFSAGVAACFLAACLACLPAWTCCAACLLIPQHAQEQLFADSAPVLCARHCFPRRNCAPLYTPPPAAPVAVALAGQLCGPLHTLLGTVLTAPLLPFFLWPRGPGCAAAAAPCRLSLPRAARLLAARPPWLCPAWPPVLSNVWFQSA